MSVNFFVAVMLINHRVIDDMVVGDCKSLTKLREGQDITM